jgi:HEAT repeat protein
MSKRPLKLPFWLSILLGGLLVLWLASGLISQKAIHIEGKSPNTHLLNLGAPLPDQRAAARELILRHPERFMDHCLKLIESQPTQVERWLARLRGALATSSVGRWVKVAPPYWEQQTRLMAFECMTLLDPSFSQIQPLLAIGIRDPNHQIRMESAKCLANQGEEGLPLLKTLLQDADPSVRHVGFYAAYKMGVHAIGAVDLLVACLLDDQQLEPDPLLYEVFAQLGSQAVPSLGDRLHQASRPMRLRLLRAMIPLGARTVAYQRWFLQGMQDELPAMRSLAAQAFFASGWIDKEAYVAIFPLLEDEDRAVRLKALELMDTRSAYAEPSVPSLLSLLNDDDPAIRQRAERLIQRVPVEQDITRQLFNQAASTGNAYVQEVVTRKLNQIGQMPAS